VILFGIAFDVVPVAVVADAAFVNTFVLDVVAT
jgi:hypothetical protein